MSNSVFFLLKQFHSILFLVLLVFLVVFHLSVLLALAFCPVVTVSLHSRFPRLFSLFSYFCWFYLILDITSELHTITIFVIVDIQTVFHIWYTAMFMICCVPNFMYWAWIIVLYISITMNAQQNFCIAAILLLYILWKHYCNKVALTLK